MKKRVILISILAVVVTITGVFIWQWVSSDKAGQKTQESVMEYYKEVADQAEKVKPYVDKYAELEQQISILSADSPEYSELEAELDKVKDVIADEYPLLVERYDLNEGLILKSPEECKEYVNKFLRH